MPVVPRLEGQQVSQAAMPNARVLTDAPIEAFGGGKVVDGPMQAASGTLNIAARIFKEEKENGDQLAVLDADSELSQAETELLHSPDGALNKKGKDAFGTPEQVMTDYGNRAQEIEQRLTNDAQRFAFRRTVSTRQADIDRTLQRHVAVEMRNYDDQTTTSFMNNEADAAIANFQDPERVNMAISRQWGALIDYQKRNGASEEWVNEKGAAAESKIHYGVMSQMLAGGNDLAAKQYYEKNKDFFYGDERKRAEADVQEGSLRGESQRLSDDIFAKAPTMTEALAQAREIKDPKVRDATVDRVKSRYAEKKTAEAADTEDRFKGVLNTLQQTKNFDSIPVSTLNTFTLAERKGLMDYTRSLQAGIEPVTDRQVYYNLQSLASAPQTRDVFLQTNLFDPKYRNSLDNSHFDEMVKLQTGLRRNDAATQQKLDGVLNDTQVVNNVLAEFKYDPTPKDKTPAAQVATFKTAVDQAVAQYSQRTGKQPTNDELRKIARGLMVEAVTDKGVLWDTTKRAFELAPSEVPAPDRAEITRELQKRKRPVTEASILMYYRKGLIDGR